MVEKEVELNLDVLKKIKLTTIFLIAFLVLGFYLRFYHIDFPSIGYHNMKENEYIDEAIYFNEQGNFLHRQTFNFYGLENGTGYFEEYVEPPLIPYMTVPLWKILGVQIWVPRMLMILFFLGSILLAYFIVLRLTKNNYLSLLSSFLMAIMPLGIYFGRNIQPESPALFFTLLSTYFFIKWTENLDKKQLLYSAIAMSFAGLFKITFLIMIIPLLFIVPYSKIAEMYRKRKEDLFSQAGFALLGALPFIIIYSIFRFTILNPSKLQEDISLGSFFSILSPSYWSGVLPAINSYIADNFTWWFFWLAIIGLVFVLMKRKTQISKYLIGYVIAVPIYTGLLSGKIGGHAYYQMPFLPLVVMLSAYAIFIIGTIIKQMINIKYIEFAALLIILLAVHDLNDANNRVFSTIFYGQDVVGNYIQQATLPEDRFFNMGHAQDQAVCTYAKRKCGPFANLTDLLALQNEFNIKYMDIDAFFLAKLPQDDPASWKYITENYKIVLAGFLVQNGQPTIVNVLLQRGGKYNLTELQGKQPVIAKTYDTKYGNIPFYVIQNG